MKIIRFLYQKKIHWGVLNGGSATVLDHEPFTKITRTKKTVLLKKIKLLAPATPSKVVCVGLNYRKHAAELQMAVPDEPVIFIKPATSVIGPDEPIKYPAGTEKVDYEAELALVIAKKCRDISAENAQNYILGYTCLNDVTARDLQKKDGQWTRAKSFDTFCPIGPWIETSLKYSSASIRLYLNGQVKQDSTTGDLIFPIGYLVSFVSRVMTLLPGDVISTGTPSGVGPMRRGDKVEVEIAGIGRLCNHLL